MSERRPDWLPVAQWEIYRMVRRKDFIISILITPLLVLGATFVSDLFEKEGVLRVAVVRADAAGTVVSRGPAALPPLEGFAWVDPGAAGADTAALARAVRGREFLAALVVHAGDDGHWVADAVTRRSPPRWMRTLREHLRTTARRERAAEMGMTPAQLAALDDSVTVRVHAAIGRTSGNRIGDFVVTFGMQMLLIAVLMTSISYIMVGVSGEKQARVTEVVVSAIPAQAWMDGKIVAFTVLGLITGVVWTFSLLLLAAPLAFRLPSSINPMNFAITAVFTLLGLYFYNAMMCALIASAQSMQSASRWQSNFMLLPFIPFFFLSGMLENPDSRAMMVLSQVPPFAPMMIPPRLVMNAVQPWEVVLALVLLVAACWFVRIVAGRVFRLGMLLYGKDMTLPELIRWARTP